MLNFILGRSATSSSTPLWKNGTVSVTGKTTAMAWNFELQFGTRVH
jgi:hypothetical protein